MRRFDLFEDFVLPIALIIGLIWLTYFCITQGHEHRSKPTRDTLPQVMNRVEQWQRDFALQYDLGAYLYHGKWYFTHPQI